MTDDVLWPYIMIFIAGFLATDIWRWLGVFIGAKLNDESTFFLYVRLVATALIAAVIGKLIVFPSGELENTTLLLRSVAAATGFLVYLFANRQIGYGILAAELLLISGWHFFPV
jgi:hypothetical protein